jgi:hypothetical protein
MKSLLEGRAAITADAPASDRDALEGWAARARQGEPVSAEGPSKADAIRAQVDRAYAENMRILESHANKVDPFWDQYQNSCPESRRVSSSGQRPWFGFENASVAPSSDQCAELARNLRQKVARVRQMMEQVEEDGRRHGVLPGTQRELRTVHRLEW